MTEKKKKRGCLKNIAIGIGVVFVFFVVMGMILDNSTDKPKASSYNENDSIVSEVVQPVKKSVWQYDTTVNEITNKKNYVARCTSTNELEFEFPNHGGTHFILHLRNNGGKKDAVLQGVRCHFMSSIMGQKKLLVRFDDRKPMHFTYGSSNDGRGDVIFINKYNYFIQQVKKSKKVMIEAPFYNAGRQVVKFDLEGLNW